MTVELLEKILTPILEEYINVNFDFIERSLISTGLVQKEQVEIIRNMRIVIHSNDHNPPHFHVISNDHTIDAKFLIETGELHGGDISSKDQKRIKAFYQNMKTQIIMKKIWDKRI